MKKIFTLVITTITSILTLAQAPAMINYQGVARSSNGNALANQSITIRLSIHDLTAAGAIMYQETRNVTTSSLGLFNVAIGSPGATAVSGSMGVVDWANGAKFLQVEMDPSGGSTFLNMGTTQLLSVPYALNAAGAAPIGAAGGDLSGTYPNPTVAKLRNVNVSPAAPATSNVLAYNGTDWTPTTLTALGAASGSGTLNYVPKWSPNGTTLANSQLFDNGVSVGLGTNVPNSGSKLDITANLAQMRVHDLDNNTDVWIVAPGFGYTGGIGTGTNHDFPIFTNGIDKVTVKTTGDVGIGISAPAARLHTSVTGNTGIRSDVAYSIPFLYYAFQSANIFASTGTNFGLFAKNGAQLNANQPLQGGAGVFGFDSTDLNISNGLTGYSVGNAAGRAGVYGFGSKNSHPTSTWYWSGYSGGTFVGGDNGINAFIVQDPNASLNGDQPNKSAINASTSYTNPTGTNYGLFVQGVFGGGTNYAGYFNGNVTVNGNFTATGAKAFRIDHPLDPANKYLSHYAMESPEVQNVYNGNVTTDASGRAVVHLPDYFAAVNKDFKYQLTIIDESQFAMARISKKIRDNVFEIMTDKPNIEVSWQVTAVRNDKAAQAFVQPAVMMKPANERGKYLNPELYGMARERSLHAGNGMIRATGKGPGVALPPVDLSKKEKELPAMATEEMVLKENGQK